MKITDDCGNVINDLGDKSFVKTIDGKTYTPIAKIDLEKGDMTYDRSLDYNDYNVYGNHIANNKKISYLQKCIGDLDSDGKIGGSDNGIIYSIISGEQ